MQTQVIPYLRELVKGGYEISLLTFEPATRVGEKGSGGVGETGRRGERESEFRQIRELLADEGIDWHWLPYHKWPSAIATAWDILRGTIRVWRLNGKKKFDVLHGRVHIPTLMGALARMFSSHKPKLLFDIRGFFPEEYTDAGIWPENGLLYRSAKRVEKWLMKEADGFVILTEKARDILFPESIETGKDKLGRPVEVIPCCVDLKRFAAAKGGRLSVREELGIEGRKVYTYVGSFGGWYLTDEMIDLFTTARERDPNSFTLILTQRDKEKISNLLTERGFGQDDFYVGSVPPSEISKYLEASDVAVSFIKACYSKQSSSPTKLAEYLACGLPIIANRGVGDVDKLIQENGVGVLIDAFTKESYLSALNQIDGLGDISEECRKTAEKEFDLETVGGGRYRRIYSRMVA